MHCTYKSMKYLEPDFSDYCDQYSHIFFNEIEVHLSEIKPWPYSYKGLQFHPPSTSTYIQSSSASNRSIPWICTCGKSLCGLWGGLCKLYWVIFCSTSQILWLHVIWTMDWSQRYVQLLLVCSYKLLCKCSASKTNCGSPCISLYRFPHEDETARKNDIYLRETYWSLIGCYLRASGEERSWCFVVPELRVVSATCGDRRLHESLSASMGRHRSVMQGHYGRCSNNLKCSTVRLHFQNLQDILYILDYKNVHAYIYSCDLIAQGMYIQVYLKWDYYCIFTVHSIYCLLFFFIIFSALQYELQRSTISNTLHHAPQIYKIEINLHNWYT